MRRCPWRTYSYKLPDGFMIFELDQDLKKEKSAIELYLKRSGNKYKKLSPSDVDFRILNDSKSLVGYADVKVLDTTMKDSFPLSVDARKIIKLRDKRLSAVMIWYCIDGILYLPIEGLKGEARWCDVTGELTLYYNDKKIFKYVKP